VRDTAVGWEGPERLCLVFVVPWTMLHQRVAAQTDHAHAEEGRDAESGVVALELVALAIHRSVGAVHQLETKSRRPHRPLNLFPPRTRLDHMRPFTNSESKCRETESGRRRVYEEQKEGHKYRQETDIAKRQT
jgi:hypothetical protein